jgi:hypothetical protein
MKNKMLVFLIGCLVFLTISVAAQSGFKTFNDTVGLYSFSYPQGYEIKKLSPISVLITSPLSSVNDKFRETLTINLGRAPENISIDSIATLLTISSQRTYLLLKDLKREKITIGGFEGRKISMTVIDKELTAVSESFALIKGVFMRMSYQNEFQLDNSKMVVFNKLIESIKIK